MNGLLHGSALIEESERGALMHYVSATSQRDQFISHLTHGSFLKGVSSYFAVSTVNEQILTIPDRDMKNALHS
jgi:hypothetical protein